MSGSGVVHVLEVGSFGIATQFIDSEDEPLAEVVAELTGAVAALVPAVRLLLANSGETSFTVQRALLGIEVLTKLACMLQEEAGSTPKTKEPQ